MRVRPASGSRQGRPKGFAAGVAARGGPINGVVAAEARRKGAVVVDVVEIGRDLPLCMEFLGDLTPRNQVSANVAARTNHAPVRLHWPNPQGSQYWRANLAARGPIGALR